MEQCPYEYNSDWLLKWLWLFLCKISIALIAEVALWVAKEGHKKENDSHLQYLDYNGRYRNECQGSYEDFCEF